ncbi:TPA: hypothetical protein JLG33_000084 [Escherichia coli]|nr:hypothetical protein [Escherichia coli]
MIFKFIRKVKVFLTSLYLSVIYFLKACVSGQNLHDGNADFIISLTTYGRRFDFVFLTIESILAQSIKPAKIYLWVYKKDKPSFLSGYFLNKQLKRGLIIKYVDEDIKSYKKLSYILNVKRDFKYVITADDDVFYPRDWLRGFVEHPRIGQSILCYRGRVITFEKRSDNLVSYKSWPFASEIDNDSNAILPTGVSGVCYPVQSLDLRISDFNSIQKLCPYADDIWYKLLTTSNGYNSLVLKSNNSHYPPLITSLAKGLEKINVGQELNIKQFSNSLDYFGLQKKDFITSVSRYE